VKSSVLIDTAVLILPGDGLNVVAYTGLVQVKTRWKYHHSRLLATAVTYLLSVLTVII